MFVDDNDGDDRNDSNDDRGDDNEQQQQQQQQQQSLSLSERDFRGGPTAHTRPTDTTTLRVGGLWILTPC